MPRETRLSPEALLCLHAIGHGMRLRVPSEGQSQIVEGQKHLGENRPSIDVPMPVLTELLDNQRSAFGYLGRLDEETTPYKIGWRQAQIDGEHARIYALVQ